MRLRPTFKKSYLIKYERKTDVQTTEVVDTDWIELRALIAKTFQGRFKQYSNMGGGGFVPATYIKVLELDHTTKTKKYLDFIITKDDREYKKNRVAVFNLSPREVRIELEKAINRQ